MAEVRAGRGWSTEALRARLAVLAGVESTLADRALDDLTPAEGWRAELSEAVIGREPPGPPLAGGFFERAREELEGYAFSDPTIVEGHFDPAAPLLGRRMLLELKVLGLRYLCGVAVTEVVDQRDDRATRFGFRYDTLAGHLERGAEWFLLSKDHRSGEISLRIESRWRLGEFPDPLSRVGFSVLAPYYRRLWLHRAHERLAAAAVAPVRPLIREALADVGPPARALPAQVAPTPGPRGPTLAAAATLGALTGMRSMSGTAAVARRAAATGPRPGAGPLERAFSRPGAGLVTSALAALEMAADKSPRIPDRVSPPALVGRFALGALAGALLARRWRQPAVVPAMLGALTAGASAVVSHDLRKRAHERLGIPSALLGAAEDALVAAGAHRVAERLARAEPPAYTLGHTEQGRPRATRRVTD